MKEKANMGIKQNDDGSWTASYSKRHPLFNTPISQRKIGLKTKVEAMRVYNDLVASVNDKIKEKTSPAWRLCIEDYVNQLKLNGYTEKTIYSIYVCIRKYTNRWNNRAVDSITVTDIFSIINGMENTSGHKSFVLQCIRGVFNHAFNKGYIKNNPTPKIKIKSADKIMPVLTEAQVNHFLTQARDINHEWYPIWACAIFTGMRNGELYALKKANVNVADRTILVNQSWNNMDGFKSTKSGDDRIIEIPNPLIPIIEHEMAKRSDSEFLLPRIPKWYKGEQARCLRQFLAGIGLPQIRFHDLRASWATMLLAKGVAPAKVMAMGGWKDMETMMIYMRKAGLDIKGATNCLDNVFNPTAHTANVLAFNRHL